VLKQISKAINDPSLIQTWLMAKLASSRCTNKLIENCKTAGFKKPCFLLSFDCDLDSDSTVVTAIHTQLMSRGIYPLYAVPGEILGSSATIYRDLAQDGSIFINHGFKRHAVPKNGIPSRIGSYFYENLSRSEWQKDIKLGHEAIADIIGQPPDTFRTPHFGSFESPRNLNDLWTFLASKSYSFSSSTRPLFGLRYGPFFNRFGVTEFPLSGCLSQPEQILDSWGLVGQTISGHDRLTGELQKYLSLMRSGHPVLLNIYMDPGDIADNPEIINTLGNFAPFSAKNFAEIAKPSLVRHP